MSEVLFILLVEDTPEHSLMTRIILEKKFPSIRVEAAANGRLGLARLRELSVENRLPDVVILDVDMPVMNGFEVLSVIRQDSMLSALAVLMLTDYQEDPELMEGFTRGANAYLGKPVDPAMLVEAIEIVLSEPRTP